MSHSERIEQRIAELHSKHGVKFDKTTLAITEIMIEEISETLSKQEKTVYQVKDAKQAFLYGLGKHLWATVLVLSLTVLALVWYFFVSDNYRFREAEIKTLSKEQQEGLETFKGVILNTWGTGRITRYTPPGTNSSIDVLVIPKSSANKEGPAGLSYYEDNSYIYIKLK